jgi:hypothetical protein
MPDAARHERSRCAQVFAANACRKLTDASLGHISKLQRLHGLNVVGWSITDAGLMHVADPPLQRLELPPCVSDEGVQAARAVAHGTAFEDVAAVRGRRKTAAPAWFGPECSMWVHVMGPLVPAKVPLL